MNIEDMDLIHAQIAFMTLRYALIEQLGDRFPHGHFKALLSAAEAHDPERDHTARQLADELLEACYHTRELDYRMLDAERHLKAAVSKKPNYENIPLDREDERIVAERFIENYDSNVAENEQFAHICTEYLDELLEGGYGT